MKEEKNTEFVFDTICALSTAPGTGAIALIRLSGKQCLSIGEQILQRNNAPVDLKKRKSHSIFHAELFDRDQQIIDDVLVSIFKAPKTYTGEDMLEISCHGSRYVQQKIIELLIDKGCRIAHRGEFTQRAFLNGRFDLAQAEAVNDLINSNTKASHDLALDQMRGGFSEKINNLRKQLIDFASLLELELDFSEEDVEFADREKLKELLQEIHKEIAYLLSSFSLGNVMKHGVPVAIVGKPNVGKSTLLNALLNEEKAIVSEIPGTTRDAIEDTIVIEDVAFRFIDTAGLRPSDDVIENIGIERTYEKIRQASIVLYLFDLVNTSYEEICEVLSDFREHIEDKNKHFIIIGNKTDQLSETPKAFSNLVDMETIFISAKRKENISLITNSLVESYRSQEQISDVIISNSRHYEALSKSLDAIESVMEAFEQQIPTDLIAIDIRQALHFLGSITGQITTDDLLGNIFKNFCIGK